LPPKYCQRGAPHGIVRREEQGEHEEEAAETCGTHHDAEEESEPDRQFAIGYQEGTLVPCGRTKPRRMGAMKG